MIYMDRTYDFKGQWDAPSRCGLKIVTGKDGSIVIVTELFEENPGTSVTGFIARLATQVVKEFGLDPARSVWADCRKDAEVLGGMEEALYSRALAVVLGEAGALCEKRFSRSRVRS